MEIFTIFLPCWEVVRHQSLIRETLDAITQWEKKTKASGSEAKSINSVPTMVDSIMSGFKSTDGSVKTNSSDDSILTMSALEYVLERNPTPLLEFSALHDFSAENIAFLTSVTEWKNSLPKGDGDHVKELIRERFNRALTSTHSSSASATQNSPSTSPRRRSGGSRPPSSAPRASCTAKSARSTKSHPSTNRARPTRPMAPR